MINMQMIHLLLGQESGFACWIVGTQLSIARRRAGLYWKNWYIAEQRTL